MERSREAAEHIAVALYFLMSSRVSAGSKPRRAMIVDWVKRERQRFAHP